MDCEPCKQRGKKSWAIHEVYGAPMCQNCFSGKPVRRREMFEDWDFMVKWRPSEERDRKDAKPFHGRREWSDPRFFSMCLAIPRVCVGSGLRPSTPPASYAPSFGGRKRWLSYRRSLAMHDYLIANIFSRIRWIPTSQLDEIRRSDAEMERCSQLSPLVGVKGIDHPQAKLTDEEVVAIRYEIARGDSLFATAEKYGVSRSLVSLIARGEHRAAIGGPFTDFTSEQRSAVSRRVVSAFHNKTRRDSGRPVPPDSVPYGQAWCCGCGRVLPAIPNFSPSQLIGHGRWGMRCRPCLSKYQRAGKLRRGHKPATGTHPYRQYKGNPPPDGWKMNKRKRTF